MDHLEKLSEELVAVSRKVAPWIVRVNGRRGPNATGVLWNETKIVTSHRACHRDADIEIGLPDGTTTLGRITGRAPAVDLVTVELPSPVADFEPIPWSAKSGPGLCSGPARQSLEQDGSPGLGRVGASNFSRSRVSGKPVGGLSREVFGASLDGRSPSCRCQKRAGRDASKAGRDQSPGTGFPGIGAAPSGITGRLQLFGRPGR